MVISTGKKNASDASTSRRRNSKKTTQFAPATTRKELEDDFD
jgi:hypothetical protein